MPFQKGNQLGKRNIGNKYGLGHKVSEEMKEKLRKERKWGWTNWKGGLYSCYHIEAKKLFAKPYCEDCGILRENRKRFEMHCISGNWKILEQWNWQCLCNKCHHKTYKYGKQ